VTALPALAASVLWVSSDFGGGLISRRLDPSAAVLVSQALALAGRHPGQRLLRAASRGALSVAAVLASLYPVVTALLARGILAERLRPVQGIGVVAALASCC
jgi:uncharacterized membrane protein